MNPFKEKDKNEFLQVNSQKLVPNLTNTVSQQTSRFGFVEGLLSQVKDFFLSMGSPRMKIRKALGAPQSNDFNNTMNEIEEDIQILYDQSKRIQRSAVEDFNYSSIEQKKLFYETSRIQEMIGDLEMYAENAGILSQSGTEIVYGCERFLNKDHIDNKLVAGTFAHVDTEGGFLSLARGSYVNHFEGALPQIQPGKQLAGLPDIAKLIIGENSNGMSGNTHEVFSLKSNKQGSWAEDSNLSFVGGETGHVNLYHMIDGNKDTWYEYEAVNVPDSVKDEVQPAGIDYNPSFCMDAGGKPLPWAFNPMPDNVLRLQLRFTLPEAQIISSINIASLIPPNNGAMPPVIKGIHVYSSDDNSTNVYSQGQDFHETIETLSFSFNPIRAKHVDIEFEQRGSFEADIGYFVHRRETVYQTTHKRLFARDTVDTSKDVQYVEGPMIPVDVIGVIIDDHTGTLDWVANTLASTGVLITAGVNLATSLGVATTLGPVGLGFVALGLAISLFRGQKVTTVLEDQIHKELYYTKGSRWCIAIKDVKALSNSYNQESEIVSKAWRSGSPIRRISLESIQSIPFLFPAGEDWVKYSISIDQGNTWHRIQPENLPSDKHPTMYVINSVIGEYDQQAKIGYLDSANDVHDVHVKIQLKRPIDIDQAEIYSPIVDQYKIKMQIEVNPN